MIYVVYGNDTYLVKQEVSRILKQFHIESEATETFDYDESILDDVLASAMTIPFLTDNKAVIWNNVRFLSKEKSVKLDNTTLPAIERYLGNPNPTTLFIWTLYEDQLDERLSLVKQLKKESEMILCKKDEDENLFSVIKKELSKDGYDIDSNALQLLLTRASSETMNLMNEVEKLKLYAMDSKRINASMVQEIVSRNFEENIFQLVNAMMAKDFKLMMSIYEDLLTLSIDPVWMMGVMMKKFQDILYTKELLSEKKSFDDLMKIFHASKGRVYYMTKNANETSDQMLFEMMDRLSSLDYKIKSGQIDRFIGFEKFLYALMS